MRAENLLKHMHGLGRKELLPSLKTYRLVLMALRNSDDHDRFERSEVLLREMYDLHEQGGYTKTIKPTEVSESYHQHEPKKNGLLGVLTCAFNNYAMLSRFLQSSWNAISARITLRLSKRSRLCEMKC